MTPAASCGTQSFPSTNKLNIVWTIGPHILDSKILWGQNPEAKILNNVYLYISVKILDRNSVSTQIFIRKLNFCLDTYRRMHDQCIPRLVFYILDTKVYQCL